MNATTLPHLAEPIWLCLLALLPLLAWRHHRRPRVAALTYSRLPAGTGGAWRQHLPFYCRLAALALLVVALSRPQLAHGWEESTTEGIDVEIVLDVSGSMAAEDFQPRNRLAVAREVVKEFIESRSSDRLGLVIFAGTAVTRAPLTTDRRMLQRIVDKVELNTLPDGTAIGVALATAASRLKGSDAVSRVIVLVTDGANNGGEIAPRSAAALCAGMGIRVYTIGVGTDGRVPVPRTYINRQTGAREVERVYARMEVDEELLQHIAERTGGKFFKATDRNALRQVFQDIDRLETSKQVTQSYVTYQEAFPPLVAIALGLLLLPLLAAALGLTVEP